MSRIIFKKFDKIQCFFESTSKTNVVESRVVVSSDSITSQSAPPPPRNESF